MRRPSGLCSAALLSSLAACLASCGSDSRSAPSPGVLGSLNDAGVLTSPVVGVADAAARDAGGGAAAADSGAPEGDAASEADAGEPPLPAGVCGDGELNLGEACDGPVLDGFSCLSFGYDEGQLSCSDGCQFDASACTGVESCTDGRDNDGDGQVDCADADCAEGCQDACLAPVPLDPPEVVSGDNFGKPSITGASCSAAAGSGPEVIYAVTATQTGVLDVTLSSAQLLTLSVRTDCAEVSSEQACGFAQLSSVPVSPGQSLFIVVEGAEPSDVGTFELAVTERAISCGDFRRDVGEGCDDGNSDDGDGCDELCNVEDSGDEPNGNRTLADDFEAPAFYGQMGGANDIDFIRFEVSAGTSSVIVQTSDFGDGACASNSADTVLSIRDAEGSELASDDDGGDGRCSEVVLDDPEPGEYYAVVRVAPSALPESFPFVLTVFEVN